ncbi:hypothetical protein IKL64_01360 [bacterium]|nr:hypothetical protein [bacterium]
MVDEISSGRVFRDDAMYNSKTNTRAQQSQTSELVFDFSAKEVPVLDSEGISTTFYKDVQISKSNDVKDEGKITSKIDPTKTELLQELVARLPQYRADVIQNINEGNAYYCLMTVDPNAEGWEYKYDRVLPIDTYFNKKSGAMVDKFEVEPFSQVFEHARTELNNPNKNNSSIVQDGCIGDNVERKKSGWQTKEVYIMQDDGAVKCQEEVSAYVCDYHFRVDNFFGDSQRRVQNFVSRLYVPINNDKFQINEATTSLKAKGATVSYQLGDAGTSANNLALDKSYEEAGVVLDRRDVTGDFYGSELDKQMQDLMSKYVEHTSLKDEKPYFVLSELPDGVTDIKLNHVGNAYTMAFNYGGDEYVMSAQIPDKK